MAVVTVLSRQRQEDQQFSLESPSGLGPVATSDDTWEDARTTWSTCHGEKSSGWHAVLSSEGLMEQVY